MQIYYVSTLLSLTGNITRRNQDNTSTIKIVCTCVCRVCVYVCVYVCVCMCVCLYGELHVGLNIHSYKKGIPFFDYSFVQALKAL